MRQSIDFPPCLVYRLPPFALRDCVCVRETHCIHEAVSGKSRGSLVIPPYRVISIRECCMFIFYGRE